MTAADGPVSGTDTREALIRQILGDMRDLGWVDAPIAEVRGVLERRLASSSSQDQKAGPGAPFGERWLARGRSPEAKKEMPDWQLVDDMFVDASYGMLGAYEIVRVVPSNAEVANPEYIGSLRSRIADLEAAASSQDAGERERLIAWLRSVFEDMANGRIANVDVIARAQVECIDRVLAGGTVDNDAPASSSPSGGEAEAIVRGAALLPGADETVDDPRLLAALTVRFRREGWIADADRMALAALNETAAYVKQVREGEAVASGGEGDDERDAALARLCEVADEAASFDPRMRGVTPEDVILQLVEEIAEEHRISMAGLDDVDRRAIVEAWREGVDYEPPPSPSGESERGREDDPDALECDGCGALSAPDAGGWYVGPPRAEDGIGEVLCPACNARAAADEAALIGDPSAGESEREALSARVTELEAALRSELDCLPRSAALLCREAQKVEYALDRLWKVAYPPLAAPSSLSSSGERRVGDDDSAGASSGASPILLAPHAEPSKGVQEARELDGVGLIAAERRRQVEQEGWTPEHDDEHDQGELARAGACYAQYAGTGTPEAWGPPGWPWDVVSWKPSENPVRDLAKAGALCAAEIDRLQRAELVAADEAASDEPQDGDRVRVTSGDYAGKTGLYEGRRETTDAHLVHLDGDPAMDPPVACDAVERLVPSPAPELPESAPAETEGSGER